MRKRSKYRPKGVRLDTMAYIKEGMTPIAQHGGYLMTVKIRNHAAMAVLTKGEATRQDIDLLIEAVNICEALYRLGFGREYKDTVKEGMEALLAVGRRGLASGRFILTGPEMTALNLLMELHDAQLDLCTIKDMEQAIELVNKERALKKMTPITIKEG